MNGLTTMRKNTLRAVCWLASCASACFIGEVNDRPRTELPLPIPPTLKPTSSDATADYYTITQRPGLQQVFPTGPATPIEGYEGTWPGPTLRVRRGRPAVVNQINNLSHPVVVHNHGHKVEAASDGHPVDFVMPGQSREYRYPNDQPAGTFWLHDHTVHVTSKNVWRGLAMYYIIDDDVWDSLNLPSGQYDVPLLIQDRAFNADQTLFIPIPQFGNVGCVNGVRIPTFKVARRKYLFRVLNGSDHRIFRLFVQQANTEQGRDTNYEWFKVVASDGGLLPRSVDRQDILLSPAERYAIVFDFSRYPVGTQLRMRNNEPPPPGREPISDVMRFEVDREAPEPDTSVVPNELVPIERLDPAQAVVTRHIDFGRNDSEDAFAGGNWFINGHAYDPARIDFRGKLNTSEIWEITNSSQFSHSLHVHLAQFQLLDVDGAAPQPEQMGWKDTVLVRSRATARFIVKWESFTGIYVFHCHLIGHEDNAMMGQIEITN